MIRVFPSLIVSLVGVSDCPLSVPARMSGWLCIYDICEESTDVGANQQGPENKSSKNNLSPSTWCFPPSGAKHSTVGNTQQCALKKPWNMEAVELYFADLIL